MAEPPKVGRDSTEWDEYFRDELKDSHQRTPRVGPAFRFLEFALEKGGHVWFPGCGIDACPRMYAAMGCNVIATDFSSVAIEYQKRLADADPRSWLKDPNSGLAERLSTSGTFATSQHDFTKEKPPSTFDVVINSLAFQGLSESDMHVAARHYMEALRPGGTLFVDTMNVQGRSRNVIEQSLASAGFFIAFSASERWYRDQLEATGIVHLMILGYPDIPNWRQYPEDRFEEYETRDRAILESFRAEYERRREEEASLVEATMKNEQTVEAIVVYSTG
jgi:2-polyprenyl-3-methyl-5-hydroxy-6-metoxy-1,4-benzoquinol methylase